MLDFVSSERVTIFKPLVIESQALLFGRDSCELLDFGFHKINAVVWIYLERQGLAISGLNVDLHSVLANRINELKSRLVLDLVLRKRVAAIVKLPSVKS